MYSQKMYELGTVRSVIRELFEYGKQRAAKEGADKVFDFSLGNPSIPAPQSVEDTIMDLVKNGDPIQLHGYTSAQGDASVRQVISDSINRRFGTKLTADCIYMTCGAAASLTISIHALAEAGDEFITFTPFFPEYRVFVEGANCKLVPCKTDADFQIDFEELDRCITPHTKAIIMNSPNNPSGVVFPEESIEKLAQVLRAKSNEYQHPIFLITDEPYRELVYGGVTVPYVMNYYEYTMVCYSYSKSLSLPGERIGYIAVSNQMADWQDVYFAVCGAGRMLGYVCAPSMMQQVIARNVDQTSDISVYEKNCKLLYDALTSYGYHCVRPDGAFYLFVEALEPDANKFSDRAKEFGLLLVPGDSFGAPGYVRIAYCVTTEMIERSLPYFKQLADTYR
jgi:aspartate aminotransferase